MESTNKYRGLLEILGNRNPYSFYALFLFGGICTVLYYFGEVIDFAGWETFRWEVLASSYEIQRLFFLAPIIYAGYVFGVKAAIIVTFLTAGTILAQSIFCSCPDPLIRPAVFCVIACAVGYIIARVHDQSKRIQK
ncbi:hypothetical protein ACFLVJ_01685 [Chloroflexota bacterium]